MATHWSDPEMAYDTSSGSFFAWRTPSTQQLFLFAMASSAIRQSADCWSFMRPAARPCNESIYTKSACILSADSTIPRRSPALKPQYSVPPARRLYSMMLPRSAPMHCSFAFTRPASSSRCTMRTFLPMAENLAHSYRASVLLPQRLRPPNIVIAPDGNHTFSPRNSTFRTSSSSIGVRT